jgi:hypothetical protein
VPLAKAFDLVICRATGVRAKETQDYDSTQSVYRSGRVAGVPVAWKCLSRRVYKDQR